MKKEEFGLKRTFGHTMACMWKQSDVDGFG